MTTRLKQVRENMGLTQEQLATKLGVSRQTIHSIESGKYIASLPLALKIAHYFNLKVEDLFHL